MKRLLWIALAALLASLPLWQIGDYYVNLASQILIAALFALSLNLLVGYAGLTSLGHAGYLGLSAYVSGWLMLNLQWGHLPAALAALAATTLMAALFGLIALRASGLSFLMITLALGQILWGVAYRWASVTGGDNGLSGLTRPSPFGLDLGDASLFYWFTLAVFALIWGVAAVWVRSPFGATIRGTKDQPRRMSALGYNVWLIRWITFIVSGFLGAVAGLMYVYYQQFISPHSLSLANSAEMLLMVIAGGAGTLAGPVVGAALVVLLKNVASAYVDRWIMLLGFVFLFIVLFVPSGIVPGLAKAWARLRRAGPAEGASTIEPKLAKEAS
ncbi:amino acid/amide ABC transporter membrane protein 2, HAAT family [Noviherbaspirillum humi]|uniref:Amino acid/amide ABC transporter membrane protein 2, HAAT family n=1 Tax=Noviherbaspirillum humi TaxID=1688639 RepID=A0A239J9N1_9BURK|nr:branched-chain amino acid ABC transporter permease [Noviherbaspirillum humi]SNT02601.1 amino acid/amide ABC transporter membrane protein 2, HAAT family [Noviherbaspirillum humi]